MADLVIRYATERDLPAIARLYDSHVRETPVTFDVEPGGIQARREWLSAHDAGSRHVVLVAKLDGSFAGFASSSSFRSKSAYQSSVELSVYLEASQRRKRVGRQLYEHLIELLRERGVHRAYAGVTLPNDASERFHEALGFVVVGTYDEVGFKLGRYWSVRWFERRL